MSLVITIVCFAISAGMLISLLTLLKRSKKMKKLIACVDQIGDEAQFFPVIDQFITSIQDPEFAAKGEILKLWGLIKYYHELSEIEACLQRIDLSKIIIDPKHRRRNKIGLNEDSFYYLCFACSFKAYSQNKTELLNRLHEKVLEKEDYFQDQLFYQLYTASWNWYTKQGDRGEAVFLDLTQGLIRKMKCSRQMLDIYRNIAAAFLAGIAQDRGDAELAQRVEKPVSSWAATEMGGNILRDLGIREVSPMQSWSKTESAEEEKPEK